MKNIKLKVKFAVKPGERIRGLIGENKIYPLLIKTRFGIHTFGVKQPMDIIILDEENTVKLMKKRLLPNKFFFWKPVYNKVLELPAGYIRDKKLEVGDRIGLI